MEPFIPSKLPLDISKWNLERILTRVSAASSALAYYNGILESMINPSIFLSPLETKEAILSSRIEGTVTTIDEVLKYEVDLKPENGSKQNDIIEVLNYRKATRLAKDWLQRQMPFNLTMICAIQKELITGVRGRDKKPGELRNEQVWIGPKFSKIDDASFVPPEPLSVKGYLDDLLTFLHSDDMEVLIQTAIMHAQFEIIHPFMDGNGRTGRILIPLYLWNKKRLTSPSFYISEYFDEYRDAYVGNLLSISQKENWEGWVNFFLDAVNIQAGRNAKKANQVLSLYAEMKDRVTAISNSPFGIKILDSLFSLPVLRTSDFMQISGLNHQTTFRTIARLKQEGILVTIQKPSGRLPEVLRFEKLFDLINT
jgi:Fic family protein